MLWYHPSSLTDNISPIAQDASNPQLAMDSNGNVIVVWEQSDGANSQIFKSEYRSGVWAHPSNLSDNISPDGEDATSPQVAMDSSGNVIVVWKQSNGANSQIFKSEYRNGAWTHPADVNDNISPDGQTSSDPKIAMDDDGDAIIVWSQNDSARFQIFKSEYRSGAWAHPADLTDNISPDGQHASDPTVTMDYGGNAIIVWRQSDGAQQQVFKSEYRSGAWAHPADLTDNISPNGQTVWGMPRVAMDNNGDAIIVWRQSDGGTIQLFKSEYRSGAWAHPALTDNISSDATSISNLDASVAMDDSGNAVIAWTQEDAGSIWQVYKSEYRSGSWTHPSGLADNISPDGTYAEEAKVALDGEGNAIVIWNQDDGSSYQIFKSEYRSGVWTHPADLSDNFSPDGQSAYGPQLAIGSNGKTTVVWYQFDGSNNRIFKSEYR